MSQIPRYIPAQDVLPDCDAEYLRRLADSLTYLRDRLHVLAHAKDRGSQVTEQLSGDIHARLGALHEVTRELCWIEEPSLPFLDPYKANGVPACRS